ncbi:YegJ family protein [Aquimarina sp. 433]
MKNTSFLILVILFFTFSCKEERVKNTSSQDIKVGKDDRDVVIFDPQNSTMNQAMLKGKKTFDKFIEAFNNKKENQKLFSVKVKINDLSNTEYLWISELTFKEEKTLKGVLQNDPYYINNINIGDTITIDFEKVVDWSYIEDNYLIGGYTLRVMFEKYKKEQKNEILKQLGYQIDSKIGI